MSINTTNMTGFVEWANFTNAQTGNIFGVLLVLGTFLICFFALGLYAKRKGFAVASLMTFTSALMLTGAGIAPPSLIIVSVIMTGVGVFFVE